MPRKPDPNADPGRALGQLWSRRLLTIQRPGYQIRATVRPVIAVLPAQPLPEADKAALAELVRVMAEGRAPALLDVLDSWFASRGGTVAHRPASEDDLGPVVLVGDPLPPQPSPSPSPTDTVNQPPKEHNPVADGKIRHKPIRR